LGDDLGAEYIHHELFKIAGDLHEHHVGIELEGAQNDGEEGFVE